MNYIDQKPSLGRIVLYRSIESNSATEHPAIITRVWSDTCVNLLVFPDNSAPVVKTSASFNDQDFDADHAYHWRWPPKVT